MKLNKILIVFIACFNLFQLVAQTNRVSKLNGVWFKQDGSLEIGVAIEPNSLIYNNNLYTITKKTELNDSTAIFVIKKQNDLVTVELNATKNILFVKEGKAVQKFSSKPIFNNSYSHANKVFPVKFENGNVKISGLMPYTYKSEKEFKSTHAFFEIHDFLKNVNNLLNAGVDSNGIFTINFTLDHPCDVTIYCENKQQTFLLIPNSEYFVATDYRTHNLVLFGQNSIFDSQFKRINQFVNVFSTKLAFETDDYSSSKLDMNFNEIGLSNLLKLIDQTFTEKECGKNFTTYVKRNLHFNYLYKVMSELSGHGISSEKQREVIKNEMEKITDYDLFCPKLYNLLQQFQYNFGLPVEPINDNFFNSLASDSAFLVYSGMKSQIDDIKQSSKNDFGYYFKADNFSNKNEYDFWVSATKKYRNSAELLHRTLLFKNSVSNKYLKAATNITFVNNSWDKSLSPLIKVHLDTLLLNTDTSIYASKVYAKNLIQQYEKCVKICRAINQESNNCAILSNEESFQNYKERNKGKILIFWFFKNQKSDPDFYSNYFTFFNLQNKYKDSSQYLFIKSFRNPFENNKVEHFITQQSVLLSNNDLENVIASNSNGSLRETRKENNIFKGVISIYDANGNLFLPQSRLNINNNRDLLNALSSILPQVNSTGWKFDADSNFLVKPYFYSSEDGKHLTKESGAYTIYNKDENYLSLAYGIPKKPHPYVTDTLFTYLKFKTDNTVEYYTIHFKKTEKFESDEFGYNTRKFEKIVTPVYSEKLYYSYDKTNKIISVKDLKGKIKFSYEILKFTGTTANLKIQE